MGTEVTRIAVNNHIIKFDFAPFRLRLMLSRVGGWELWALPERGISTTDELIGGEWAKAPFDVYIGDNHIIKNRWTAQADYIPAKDEQNTIQIGTIHYPITDHGGALEIFAPMEVREMLMDYCRTVGGIFWSGQLWSIHNTVHGEESVRYWHRPMYKEAE